jgi:gas vesicle protein
MAKNDNQINVKDFMIGAAVGVALGAAIAYLTAPKAGKEVRKDINDGIDFVRDKGQKIVLDVKTQSTDMIGKMAEVKDKVQNKINTMKDNLNDGVTQIQLDDEVENEDEIYTLK